MEVIMTLHEVYDKLKHLKEQREIYSRIIADSVIENDEEAVKSFSIKYKRNSDVIDYYSNIEVKFENKYAISEDQ